MAIKSKSSVIPTTIEEVELKGEGGLRRAYTLRTIISVMVMGIVFLIAGRIIFGNALQKTIEKELSNVAYMIISHYEGVDPGDYNLVVDENDEPVFLKKGETIISDDTSFIEEIAQETDTQITVFFYNTRLMTTFADSGSKEILGSIANNTITQEVLIEGKPEFYNDVEINKTRLCALYVPFFAKDGTCVGMVGVGRPYSEVFGYINKLSGVFALIILVAGVAASVWMVSYTSILVGDMEKLKTFLGNIASGQLSVDLEQSVLDRKDELGDMGRCALFVRGSLRKLVEKDPLTNLNNRRSGQAKMDQIRKKSRSYGTKYAVAIGDIDFFKKVNDTYGHDAGDAVLKEVARILSAKMTGKGIVVRWGGEEFLFVMEDCDLESAKALLWDILAEIRQTSVQYGSQVIRFTMSFGVVAGDYSFKPETEINAADELLYYAKEHGRNRVVSTTSEDEKEPARMRNNTSVIESAEEPEDRLDDNQMEAIEELVAAEVTSESRISEPSETTVNGDETEIETPAAGADNKEVSALMTGIVEKTRLMESEITDKSDADPGTDEDSAMEEPNEKDVELWDIYDRNKELTGRTMKRNDFTMKDGDYHLTVLGAIMNRQGEFLVTRRVMNKSYAPGCWEISGGAAKAGETSYKAILREVKEETGLDVSGADGGYMFTYRRDNPEEGDNYFVDVYRFVMDFSDDDIKLQSEETDGYMLAHAEDIRELGEDDAFLHYKSIKAVFDL